MEPSEEIIAMLGGYYRAFSTLDPVLAAQFFLQPAVFMGPPGAHCLPDRKAVENVLTTVMSGLRSQGYGGSELDIREIRLLGEHAALVAGVAIRRKSDGSELERVNIAYLTHKGESGWLIAVLLTQG